MAEVTLQEAVRKFAGDLAKKVNSFISDVSELEISTYTTPADQAETFIKAQTDFSEIETEGKLALRAYTRVSFDGDATVWVPTEASGEINKSVWDLHQTIVQQAMDNRAKMIQAVGEAATSALRALGLAGAE
jgi:hypothetical protein